MPNQGDLSFNDFLTGLWFAGFGVIGWIGSRVGVRRVPPPPSSSVEVAGALIDTRQVAALIEAPGQTTYALTECRRAIEKNTEQAREVQEEAERLSRDMRELGDRMARSGRG